MEPVSPLRTRRAWLQSLESNQVPEAYEASELPLLYPAKMVYRERVELPKLTRVVYSHLILPMTRSVRLVDPTGFEPVASSVQTRRSP